MKFFNLTNFKKHFTIVNIIVALITLSISALFKFSPLPTIVFNFFCVYPTEMHQYLLTGFLAITTRLGIKGIVENVVAEILPKPLYMDNVDNTNSGGSLSGNSQSNPQGGGGNSQPNLESQSSYKSDVVDGKHSNLESVWAKTSLTKLDQMLSDVMARREGIGYNLFKVDGKVDDLTKFEKDFIFKVLKESTQEVDKYMIRGYPEMSVKYYSHQAVIATNKGHLLVLSDTSQGKYTSFSKTPENISKVINAVREYENKRSNNNNN